MIHISVEGMDGVGKSTVCRKLAERTGFLFVEKNLRYLFDNEGHFEKYLEIRDRVNDSPDRLFTSWFYGLGNIYLHTQYSSQNIITDRYILSNYAWSGTEDNTEVYELLLKKLKKPTLTVIVYADEENITKRLKNRDIKDSDLHKVKNSEKIYVKMISFCKKYNIPYLLIDTSNLTPNEIVDKILAELEVRNDL